MPIKQCRAAKFSNGGHLFALAVNSTICVHNFYTFDLVYTLKGHLLKVREIEWLPSDLGFVSCSMGGDVFFWDFLHAVENGYKVQEKDIVQKGVSFTSVSLIPGGKNNQAFAVGSDSKIWNADHRFPFESNQVITQLQTTFNGTNVIAGTGTEGRPGSVQVYRTQDETVEGVMTKTLQKQLEIQAHRLPIEKMVLSYDNKNLITAGQDGCIYIFELKERDSKMKFESRTMIPNFSDEMITQRNEIEGINQEIDALKNEALGTGQDGNFDNIIKIRKLEEKINALE